MYKTNKKDAFEIAMKRHKLTLRRERKFMLNDLFMVFPRKESLKAMILLF